MGHRLKVLQLANSDLTIAKMLLPLVDRMGAEGYDVSAACAAGPHAADLVERGYVVHTVPIKRTISPWSTIRATWALYRLMRRERFDIVHVHTPIAAAIGRLAAKLARVPVIVYTAHGFYFHERMSHTGRAATSSRTDRLVWAAVRERGDRRCAVAGVGAMGSDQGERQPTRVCVRNRPQQGPSYGVTAPSGVL